MVPLSSRRRGASAASARWSSRAGRPPAHPARPRRPGPSSRPSRRHSPSPPWRRTSEALMTSLAALPAPTSPSRRTCSGSPHSTARSRTCVPVGLGAADQHPERAVGGGGDRAGDRGVGVAQAGGRAGGAELAGGVRADRGRVEDQRPRRGGTDHLGQHLADRVGPEEHEHHDVRPGHREGHRAGLVRSQVAGAAGVRFHTVRSCPAAATWAAMARPIRPRPRKATRTGALRS